MYANTIIKKKGQCFAENPKHGNNSEDTSFCCMPTCTDQYSSKLTKMQEDLALFPLHAELVFGEQFLVLLLFDL